LTENPVKLIPHDSSLLVHKIEEDRVKELLTEEEKSKIKKEDTWAKIITKK